MDSREVNVPANWVSLHDTRDGDIVYIYPDKSELLVKKANLKHIVKGEPDASRAGL